MAATGRAFSTDLTLSLGFVAIAAALGWKGASLALLADAGHNPSDLIGLVLASGAELAGRPSPDARRTCGRKRASKLATFVNAVPLRVAMGSPGLQALQRLQASQPAASLPAVEGAHDLHLWAMGTSDTALGAHRVMPQGHGGNRFRPDAAGRVAQRWGIGHATLPRVREAFAPGCGDAGREP